MTRRYSATKAVASLVTEAQWQKQVLDAAHIYDWHDLYVKPAMWRQGRWYTATSGKLGKGWPDVSLFRPRDGRRLAIECKAEGGRATQEQKDVLDVLARCGFETHILRPSDLPQLLELLR